MLRFLHIADLHLGMRITRFPEAAINRAREARFEALDRVREEAAKADRGYRFLIVAGDLFDDVRVPREIARRGFDLLESFPIPVLIISGNHDPLEPGSVWDADPWDRISTNRVRVLRERSPFREFPGVTIFPCPVFRKTSYDDPTAWIADHPRADGDAVRVAIAHGSVMDRPNLPPDDHPIDPDAPGRLGMDYVALGHWHRPKRFADDRMAYPGVHEPMRFSTADSSGWKPYSPGGDRDEFRDDGSGRANAVTIDHPGSPPQIEELTVGRLKWREREAALSHAEQFDELIRGVAEAPETELTLLRLRLSGTLPLHAMERLEVLQQVMGRYVVGELDAADLRVEPTEDEIRDVVGGGMLKSVFDSIASLRAADGSPGERAVAERALTLLYRYARQAQGTA
jgi:DNA repair exonuclease SbcCD nuclease subunit